MDDSIRTLDDLIFAMNLCPHKAVAVQAGGHWGVWAATLAKVFTWVYTFEPEHQGFQILTQTCSLHDNIIKIQACLGDEHVKTTVQLRHEGKNGGATHVEGKGGGIPVLRVDNLNLPDLNLLYLDIEGFELSALRGAEASIRAFKPIIGVEMKGLANRYKVKDESTQAYIESLGYSLTAERRRDKIFSPK